VTGWLGDWGFSRVGHSFGGSVTGWLGDWGFSRVGHSFGGSDYVISLSLSASHLFCSIGVIKAGKGCFFDAQNRNGKVSMKPTI